MQWWCKRAAAATVTHAGLATIYFDTINTHAPQPAFDTGIRQMFLI